MNTPIDDNHPDLRYAEYVLGVLDADARAQVAREIETVEEAAIAVAMWQRRLLPLCEEAPPLPPPPYVWARIQASLKLATPPTKAAPTARPGVWNNLRFWQWLSAGTLAAACLVIALFVSRLPSPPAISYMAATITQGNGRVGWTATMDLQNARMIVVPASPQSLAAGRAPELWLIPKGRKPISVGMIDPHALTTLHLDPALLAQLGPSAVLAVSIEPVGGSPTGQPTGPVIATGAIGVAPAGKNGKTVAVLSLQGAQRGQS